MSRTTSQLKSKIIRAGAGAGKTTRLTQQIYEVYKQLKTEQKRDPKIVATTFTRKATRELKERLLTLACKENDSDFLKYLSSGHLQLTTIHGVFSGFLRAYAGLLGWDNSFSIVSDSQAIQLKRQALQEILVDKELKNELVLILKSYNFKHLLSLLDSYYEEELGHRNFHFATEEDLKNLSLSVLKETSQQLSELCLQILESVTNEKWLKFADETRQLTENINVAIEGRKPLEAESLVQDLKELKPLIRKTKDIDEDFDTSAKDIFEEVVSMLEKPSMSASTWPQSAQIFAAFQKIGQVFVEKLNMQKRKNSWIEMRDIELLTYQALLTEAQLVEEFGREWDYWLIDEYQDTSPLQEEILQTMIGDSPAFLVGDPQQSIYLFRGARSEIFAEKEKNFFAEKEVLDINYRSSAHLLEFINHAVSGFDQTFLKMKTTKNFEDSYRTSDVVCFEAQDLEQELAFVSREILQLKESSVSFKDICILARNNKELTELSRYLGRLKIPHLLNSTGGFVRRREISDLIHLARVLVNPHDDLTLAIAMRMPWFNIEAQEIYEFARHVQQSKTKSWWSARKSFASENNLSRFLQRFEQVIFACTSLGYFESFKKLLREIGFIDDSYSLDPTGRREANIWKFLSQLAKAERRPGFDLLDFIYEFQFQKNSEGFGSDTDAVSADNSDAVQLLTVHGSKGLQFDHVFLFNCGKSGLRHGGFEKSRAVTASEGSGLFSFYVPVAGEVSAAPTLNEVLHFRETKKREVHETDRLFYVAITRAKKKLFLSYQGKIDKMSWLDRAQIQLADGSELGLNFKLNWHKHQDEALAELAPKNAVVNSRQPLIFVPPEAPQIVSVTELIDTGSQLSESTKSEKVLDNLQIFEQVSHVQLGVRFHSEVEHLQKKLQLNSNLQIESNELQWLLHLQEPPMKELLLKGHVEWGFQMNSQGAIIEGKIDLWGVHENTTWVIDYKTGSTRYLAKAQTQLAVYAQALSEFGCKNIKTAVVYQLAKKVFIESP